MFDLVGVDGVAPVVAGAVGDIGDLIFVRLAVGTRFEFVKQRADDVHDVEIRLFVPAAHVIRFAHPARFEHAPDRAAMVLDVEPVAHLLAVAIHRQRFVGLRVDDQEWNEFFRKVKGAIVVGAIGGQHRQAIGMVVGAHQVVAGGFRGGVGAVGLVLVLFAKGRVGF